MTPADGNLAVSSVLDGLELMRQRRLARDVESWIDAYVEAGEETFDLGGRLARADIPTLEAMAEEIRRHDAAMRDLLAKLNIGAGDKPDAGQSQCVADAWDHTLNPAASAVLSAMLRASAGMERGRG